MNKEEQEHRRATLTNREKFREVFGADISTVGSMCHSNGMCDPFCDNHCQWWDKKFKESKESEET